MAKKRKTLPDEFQQIVNNGTQEEFEKLMLRCLPNAVGDYYKYNAFGFEHIGEEMAEWLLDYGTDINMQDTFGNTPLRHQAMRWNNEKQVELYLKLGADIELPSHLNGGPLHGAADHGCAENIKVLLKYGADVNAVDHWGKTPLEYTLSRCGGAGIVEKIEGIELLIKAGAAITEKAKESVTEIGKDIEFRRANFSADWMPKIDQALKRLYELFQVPPVPGRRFHDGVSPITVSAKTWKEQYQELWDYLVPGSGSCKTLQGEVIRINGRLGHELLGNGGINWDRDFRIMTDSLGNYLTFGSPLPKEEQTEIQQLISIVKAKKGWEEELGRLCQLSVKWVLQNPDPIPLEKPNYRR